MLLRRLLLGGLLLALAASGVANCLLYRQAVRTYTELQEVRLDPTDAKRFSATNAALPAPLPAQSRVVLFGDSRIAMWKPLPDVPEIQFVNRGVAGETTDQLLVRVERDVVSLSPDLVVIEMGINDLKTIGLFPDRAPEIVNSCNRNIDQMLALLRERKIEAALLTVFPPDGVPLERRSTWSDKTRDAVAEINGHLRALRLPGVTIVDCDPALNDHGRMNDKYALDTLHLNEAGYAALDAAVGPVLQKTVAARKAGGAR